MDEREPVAKPAAVVSAATLASRVAGLVRESLFGALFAKGVAADAFVFAFRIPNLLRDLFAEGALSSAFVPTLARARAERGEEAASRLARTVLGTLLAVTGAVAALGIVFARPVVHLVAPSAGAETQDLATTLVRIMFPFLPTVAAAAVLMGVLNTHRRFFVAAAAPAAFNAVAIVGGVSFLLLGWGPEAAVVGWSAFVLLGGLAQALVQWPLARRVGLRGPPRVDLRFRDPGLREVLRRMGPMVVALAGTQVVIVVTSALASRHLGWAAVLNYAFRLIHLPIGLVGVAVGTVALAAASRRAAAGDASGLDDVLRRGLRLNVFLALPAAVGLAALAEPIVRVVYEHRAFAADPTATVLVVEAVRWYALGVVFYGGTKVAAAAFHARGDTRTPMLCSLAGIAVSLATACLALEVLGLKTFPIATAAGAAVNYACLRAVSRRRHGPAAGPGLPFLLRTALACAALGAATLALAQTLLRRGGPAGEGALLVLGTATVVGTTGFLYLLLAHRLGVEEGSSVRRLLARRS
jgi:putative peptidoglycan lipid II flippase